MRNRPHNDNPAGVTIVRSECPYGKQRWLGVFLTVLCILNALRVIFERVAQSTQVLDGSTVAAINAVSAAIFFSPLFSAAISSDSPPEKIGFCLCSFASVCLGMKSVLFIFISNMLIPSAILTLLAYLNLIAAFLVFSSCRDHVRDASVLSAVAAVILIIDSVLIGLIFLAAYNILNGFTVPWVRVLSFGSLGVFFGDIVLSVITAAVFFFMRTDVPNAHYPERQKYQPFRKD